MDTSILNSSWFHLVAGALMIVILSLYEVYVDKQLKGVYEKWLKKFIPKAFNADNSYKLYNRSVHDLQLPFRGTIIVLFGVLVVNTGLIDLGIYLLYLAVLYWMVFDILVNKLWLNKEWWYIGGTAKSDDLFNDSKGELILFWSLKLFGTIGFAFIYIVRLYV